MLESIVWLFPQYRAAVAENAKLAQALEAAHRQLQEGSSRSIDDMLTKYSEQLLSDQPYPDGQVPASAWLTPGGDDDDRDLGRW